MPPLVRCATISPCHDGADRRRPRRFSNSSSLSSSRSGRGSMPSLRSRPSPYHRGSHTIRCLLNNLPTAPSAWASSSSSSSSLNHSCSRTLRPAASFSSSSSSSNNSSSSHLCRTNSCSSNLSSPCSSSSRRPCSHPPSSPLLCSSHPSPLLRLRPPRLLLCHYPHPLQACAASMNLSPHAPSLRRQTLPMYHGPTHATHTTQRSARRKASASSASTSACWSPRAALVLVAHSSSVLLSVAPVSWSVSVSSPTPYVTI